MRNYRSFLFVPATEKMLGKIEMVKADAVIVDLEDAILPEHKEKALAELADFLKTYSFKNDIFVRVNPDRQQEETQALNGFPIVGYMLPKSESAEMAEEFRKYIGDKKLIALIESAVGIVNVDTIAASEAVDILAFGAEDYTAGTAIKNDDEFLMYPKSKMVLYAKANQKPVYDTISLQVTDETEYEKKVQKSKDYGFDGKLAIHPMQADVINRLYRETDVEYYRYVLKEYERCGQAVLKLDGMIYERPHIERMRRLLQEE